MGIAKKDEEKKMPAQSKKELDEFSVFRANLRLLRMTTEYSAMEFGKVLGFKKHYRMQLLEYGRGAPIKLEEARIIAAYFKISIDELLNKVAKISFEDPQ